MINYVFEPTIINKCMYSSFLDCEGKVPTISYYFFVIILLINDDSFICYLNYLIHDLIEIYCEIIIIFYNNNFNNNYYYLVEKNRT